MMKFIRSRGAHVNAERLKLQKELFEYNQTIYHGFPHRPSALAYDKKLNLLAIGTKEGDLRILGKAGVEFQAILKNQKKIDSIVFIKNTSQLLVKCEDNSVYLYEIPNNLSSNVNSDELILIKSFYHFVTESENEEKPSNHITALMVNSTLNTLYIGTENGKIHFVNLKNFDVTENAISQEIINSKLPKDVAKNLGAPEIILEHPTNSDLILIGYNRGQLVLWNLTTSNCEKVFVSDQLLEHACWSSNGDEFMSSHHDGSYIIWSTNDNVEPSQQPKIVYGPYPCKPINKIYGKSSENLIIFSGGMTRQEHGDRHTVSVFQGVNDSTKHQTLDLTSKVIDFVVIEKDTEKALIILAEEELVAIDLNDPEWSQFKLPYLSSVHSSPITFSQIYSSVDGDLIKKLEKIGSNQKTGKYSNREWPIQGGFIKEKTYQADNTLLITGHENGSVRLWNLSDIAMNPLCTINTAKFFGTDDDIVPIDSDDQNYDADEWPPFKKVGVFDPYSDDPRLGIRKVVLCLKKFSLLIAGTSGQVLVFELKEEAAKYQLTREDIDLVTGLDFVWKSHECLSLESNMISFEPGYQPTSIIQLNPPASITALALNTDWNLFSAGTTHGFAIFNYESNKTISFKCTLNPAEVSNASSGNLITRKKSLRKTLRESFRKLRKGRSLRVTKKGDKSPVVSPSKSKGSKVDVSLDYRPVERQIEAKTEDGIGSVVRYLYFANAPIINQGQLEKTLWAGTNAGNIFIYLINDAQNPDVENSSVENKTASTIVPNNSTEESVENQNETKPTTSSVKKENEVEEQTSDDKKSFDVTCQLTKEIHLKHHAPVIFIQVIDSSGHPVTSDTTQVNEGVYRVLICSEEQFKLFNLPTLKPYCKFKLTAHEGSKSRGINVSKFISKSDPNYFEHCIVNINNQGDLAIFSILDLKKQLQSKCMKKEDINGISSLVFATNGEGLFLNSPSEFSRFSVSAYKVVKPNCLISETELEKIYVETTEDVNVEAEPNQSNDTNKDKGPSATTENENQTNEQVSSKSDKNETNKPNVPESTTEGEDLKKAENVKQIAKVTEVSTKKSNDNEVNEELVKKNEISEKIEITEKKTLENGVTEIKALETEPKVNVNSCKINSTCPTVLEKKSSTEKICINKNLVNAEVHYPQLNGNGYINESVATNGKKHINLYDDDEGEGKSIDEDLDKTEENLEKSNGTPTSGIIEDDDDDDSYSDANDLNTIDAKFGKYTETKNKDLVINETEKDNSVIDNSFNITIDSVKEHFNNLVISDSHDSHDFSFGAGE